MEEIISKLNSIIERINSLEIQFRNCIKAEESVKYDGWKLDVYFSDFRVDDRYLKSKYIQSFLYFNGESINFTKSETSDNVLNDLKVEIQSFKTELHDYLNTDGILIEIWYPEIRIKVPSNEVFKSSDMEDSLAMELVFIVNDPMKESDLNKINDSIKGLKLISNSVCRVYTY